MAFVNQALCRHQECCGGPQYGCVPDYYPEHFGAGENQTQMKTMPGLGERL